MGPPLPMDLDAYSMHIGVNYLVYSKNFGMAADAYLNNSVFILWCKIYVELQSFEYRDN